MKVYALCVLVFVFVHLPTDGTAACCRPKAGKTRMCNDELPPRYLYCGKGDCNEFGCGCTGGCRGKRSADMRNGDEATPVRDVIRAADVDGDGRMSLDEADLYLADRGFPANHVRRSVLQFDVNNDNFLTAEEIDKRLQ